MNLNINQDWLLRMAEKEGNGVVSVGGLVTRIETSSNAQTTPAMKPAD
jgi:hypothetical protein